MNTFFPSPLLADAAEDKLYFPQRVEKDRIVFVLRRVSGI